MPSSSPLAASSATPGRGPLAALPGLFVVLWSSGFVGAKFGLPHAGPLTFLSLRFAIVTAVMLAASVVARAAWPSWREAGHIAVVGALLQGLYLSGVFVSLAHGVSAAVVALIVGLQPLLTAALAGAVLDERVSMRQWLGFALGFVGVALVVASKLAWDGQHLFGAATAALSLLAITLGTLYQKRFCAQMDLLSGTVIQNAVAGVLVLTGACLFEDMHIAWSASFVFALLWLCFVLSVGATLLLFVLLRRGAASRVASFFYLVPPVTAVMAYLFFGETLGAAALLGIGLVMAGVVLVNRG